MTKDQALSASYQGPCDEDVKFLLKNTKIKRQLKKISADELRDELRDELEDRDDNEMRIIWIAACNIREDLSERKKSHV